MARSVAAAIDTELAKDGIFVIDLIDFDFGGGWVFHWAEAKVDGTISFNGKLYEPRLIKNGLGQLPFTPGASDDSTTAAFDNTDLKFTDMINQGIQLQLGRNRNFKVRVGKLARQMRRQLREVWRKTLPECDPVLVDRAERLAIVSLRGLALERAVEGDRSVHKRERGALVDVLTALLQN